MNQSGVIAAAILAAFVLFLAARGRLGVYTAVLWGGTSAPLPSATAKAPAASGGGGDSDFLDTAKDAALLYFGL